MAANINARFQQFTNGLSQKYEPFVREHLARVYMVLAGTAASAAVGAVLQLRQILDLGLMSAMASLLLVLALNLFKDNSKNYYVRLSMLLAFGFCSGQTLGPLMDYIISINPAIILTALTGTIITFVSLSLAALLAERGKYLYLGGLLVSIINTMAILSLLNIFFHSYFVTVAQLYIGVFVMAAFVVFDTQNIIEKCRAGNRDVVQHALDLFFDVLSMFRRLLIILGHREEKKCDKSKRR